MLSENLSVERTVSTQLKKFRSTFLLEAFRSNEDLLYSTLSINLQKEYSSIAYEFKIIWIIYNEIHFKINRLITTSYYHLNLYIPQ